MEVAASSIPNIAERRGELTQTTTRWVYFVSGLAHITLPTSDVSAYISGEFGLIFAADTVGTSSLGHRTQYPGITETVAISMPTKDGGIPPHNLLHYGPCAKKDVAGYDDLAIVQSGIVIPIPDGNQFLRI